MDGSLAGRHTKGQPKERPKENEQKDKNDNSDAVNLIAHMGHHLTLTMRTLHSFWIADDGNVFSMMRMKHDSYTLTTTRRNKNVPSEITNGSGGSRCGSWDSVGRCSRGG